MRISNNGLRDEVPKRAGSIDRVLDSNIARGPDFYQSNMILTEYCSAFTQYFKFGMDIIT